jgi:hypothetical protein
MGQQSRRCKHRGDSLLRNAPTAKIIHAQTLKRQPPRQWPSEHTKRFRPPICPTPIGSGRKHTSSAHEPQREPAGRGAAAGERAAQSAGVVIAGAAGAAGDEQQRRKRFGRHHGWCDAGAEAAGAQGEEEEDCCGCFCAAGEVRVWIGGFCTIERELLCSLWDGPGAGVFNICQSYSVSSSGSESESDGNRGFRGTGGAG